MLANTPNPLDYAQFINGIVYSYQDLTIAITTDKMIEIKNHYKQLRKQSLVSKNKPKKKRLTATQSSSYGVDKTPVD